MSSTLINIEGSKQLLGSIFQMEIEKITETIRRESSDDKDKLILKLENEIAVLRKENSSFAEKLYNIKRLAI